MNAATGYPQQPNYGSSSFSQSRGPQLCRNSAIVFGKVTRSDDVENFQLAADVNLVASGVSRDASSEKLRTFLIGKGLQVTDIELLTTFYIEQARSFTYRIVSKQKTMRKH